MVDKGCTKITRKHCSHVTLKCHVTANTNLNSKYEYFGNNIDQYWFILHLTHLVLGALSPPEDTLNISSNLSAFTKNKLYSV